LIIPFILSSVMCSWAHIQSAIKHNICNGTYLFQCKSYCRDKLAGILNHFCSLYADEISCNTQVPFLIRPE
jgi:hypothetical protein